jgi:hypothetical protein
LVWAPLVSKASRRIRSEYKSCGQIEFASLPFADRTPANSRVAADIKGREVLNVVKQLRVGSETSWPHKKRARDSKA